MKKIEPKKLKLVNDKTLLVTIDMGKNIPVGYCRCPDRSEIKPFEFQNNRVGFTKLWDCVVKARLAKGLRDIVIGIESTGSYAEPLIHFFKDKPVRKTWGVRLAFMLKSYIFPTWLANNAYIIPAPSITSF